MADAAATEVVPGDAAEAALAFLAEMSPDLRGGAILDAGGAVLAAAGDPDRWREDAAALFEVADRAGGEPVEQVHVATEQGEVFALRHGGLAAVAVTERFALASLMFFDMRATLRDLALRTGRGRGLMPPKPHRVLLDRVSGYADEAAAYMRRRRVSRQPVRPPLLPERAQQRPRRRLGRGRRAVRRRRTPDRGCREASQGMTELIDPAVAERVLARALANGGALRRGLRRTPPGALDVDRRVADRGGPVGGRGGRRGARRQRAAPPTSPTSTASTRPTSSAPPARPPRRCEASAASRARCRRWRRRRSRSSAVPSEVAAERKAALLRELDERGPRPGRRDRPVHRLLRRGAARGRGRQLRRPAHRRRPHPGADRRPGGRPPRGHGRDRRRDPRRPPRLRAARRRPRPDRRAGGAQGADPARRRPGSVGLDAGGGRRRLRRRPLPRDDRPRPRGRPHPQGGQRLRRQARRAGRPAAAQRLRRRPPAGRVGVATRSTTRARRPRRRR